MNSDTPLQHALEKQYPDVMVMDYGPRIFVKLWNPSRGEYFTVATPHTVDARTEPWQFWLHRFRTQIQEQLDGQRPR